ncbi:MAG: rhodanese-like domain-containing protein [Desulfosarcina sp.]|jgi:sodium/bile acid cotransporter 7
MSWIFFIILLHVLTGAASAVIAATSNDDAAKRQHAYELYADYRKHFPQVEEIEPRAAIDFLEATDVVFLDVRKTEEQQVSMIPGAITKETFMDNLERYRGKRIIAYCTISYRSGKLAAKIGRNGISVVNLKAGLLGWVHAGGPLVRQQQPVQQLHVYGRKWDLAPAGIETIYFKWYHVLFAD